MKLNREKGITVILITHYMEEAIDADRIFVMDQGEVAMQGTPREIFSQVERMKESAAGCAAGDASGAELQKAGLDLPAGILTKEELVDALLGLKQVKAQQWQKNREHSSDRRAEELGSDRRTEEHRSQQAGAGRRRLAMGIKVDDICFLYERGTAMQVNALDPSLVRSRTTSLSVSSGTRARENPPSYRR